MKKKKYMIAILIVMIALAGIVHVAVEYALIANDLFTSAPPYVAFFYAVPYLAAIVGCLVILGILIRKNKN